MIESPRHDFDHAIDRVAAQLVAVREDSDLLPLVMARLPERALSPWFLAMPVQLAGGGALLLIAWLSRPAAPIDLPLTPMVVSAPVPGSPIPDPRSLIPDPRSPIPDPRSPIPDPRSPIPDLALARPDHERSLTPVEPLEPLELNAIAAPALEPDAVVVLVPLVLTELPLASDTLSPRDR